MLFVFLIDVAFFITYTFASRDRGKVKAVQLIFSHSSHLISMKFYTTFEQMTLTRAMQENKTTGLIVSQNFLSIWINYDI